MSLKWCSLVFVSVLVVGGDAKRPPPSYFEYDKIQAKILNKTLSLKEDALSLQDNFLTDQSMGWHSFSQKEPKQDVIIDTIFNDKSDGYFVDLAANDWQYLSNTLMLEYFNHWKGVCIEPNPQYLEGLLSNRKCKIYINPVSSATGDVVKFNFEGVLGGMVGNEFDNKHESTSVVELTTVTLESILDHANMPSVIDYFSLDVEGAEYHVLVNFNYTRYTFLTMTIERPSAKIHHLLVNNGYRYVYILCNFGDTLYVHHTLPNFVEIMNKHHNPNNVMWNREAHPYLLHPKWLGSYIPVHNLSEEIPVVERKTRLLSFTVGGTHYTKISKTSWYFWLFIKNLLPFLLSILHHMVKPSQLFVAFECCIWHLIMPLADRHNGIMLFGVYTVVEWRCDEIEQVFVKEKDS